MSLNYVIEDNIATEHNRNRNMPQQDSKNTAHPTVAVNDDVVAKFQFNYEHARIGICTCTASMKKNGEAFVNIVKNDTGEQVGQIKADNVFFLPPKHGKLAEHNIVKCAEYCKDNGIPFCMQRDDGDRCVYLAVKYNGEWGIARSAEKLMDGANPFKGPDDVKIDNTSEIPVEGWMPAFGIFNSDRTSYDNVVFCTKESQKIHKVDPSVRVKDGQIDNQRPDGIPSFVNIQAAPKPSSPAKTSGKSDTTKPAKGKNPKSDSRFEYAEPNFKTIKPGEKSVAAKFRYNSRYAELQVTAAKNGEAIIQRNDAIIKIDGVSRGALYVDNTFFINANQADDLSQMVSKYDELKRNHIPFYFKKISNKIVLVEKSQSNDNKWKLARAAGSNGKSDILKLTALDGPEVGCLPIFGVFNKDKTSYTYVYFGEADGDPDTKITVIDYLSNDGKIINQSIKNDKTSAPSAPTLSQNEISKTDDLRTATAAGGQPPQPPQTDRQTGRQPPHRSQNAPKPNTKRELTIEDAEKQIKAVVKNKPLKKFKCYIKRPGHALSMIPGIMRVDQLFERMYKLHKKDFSFIDCFMFSRKKARDMYKSVEFKMRFTMDSVIISFKE